MKGSSNTPLISAPGTGAPTRLLCHQHAASSSRPTNFSGPEPTEGHYLSEKGHVIIGDTTMLASDKHSGTSASHEDALNDNLARFETQRRGVLAPKTIENYLVRIHQVMKIIDKDPFLWKVKDCENLMQSTKWVGDPEDPDPDKRGWKRTTKILTRAALKSYWKFLHRTDLTGEENDNFWMLYRQPGGLTKYNERKAKTPEYEDVVRFKETCRQVILNSESPGQVYRHYLAFLPVEFGIRVKAIQNLRLCDFKFESNKLFIYRTKGDKSRNVHIEDPITDVHNAFLRAREKIITDLLGKHHDNPEVVKRLEDLRDNPEAWLFFTRYTQEPGNSCNVGRQLPGRSISGIVKTVARFRVKKGKKEEIIQYSPHAFRHAKAFELLKVRGQEPHEAMGYLGHENIQTTMDYIPQGIDEQRAAFKRTRNGNGGNGENITEPRLNNINDGGNNDLQTLTDLYNRGILTVGQYAEACAKLSREAS